MTEEPMNPARLVAMYRRVKNMDPDHAKTVLKRFVGFAISAAIAGVLNNDLKGAEEAYDTLHRLNRCFVKLKGLEDTDIEALLIAFEETWKS